ncbi:MAG: hypothetical protein KGQ41_04570 [Alphaproteobacteria bacterium]|nr:hypothetical protein [Alphaproteobacteria bacterium]
MGANQRIYSRGGLVAIWKPGEAPDVDEVQVRQNYESVFYPALVADLRRLHTVFEETVSNDTYSRFDAYITAVCDYKGIISKCALPDIKLAEDAMRTAFSDYMAGRLYGLRQRLVSNAHTLAEENLSPDAPDYAQKRLQSASFDTGMALQETAQSLLTDAGQARLYRTFMQGPAALEKLLTYDWPAERKAADLGNLRRAYYDIISGAQLDARVDHIQRTRKDKPREDDIDEARRIANIRLVVG